MSYFMKVLLLMFVFVKQETDLALALRKFVYQKDMSEYCRRRVMPSVFLGRQVVDAYSQVLHFSRLELPYSCFISVRTESGSNIILVIQLVSNRTLIDACRESKNQLLVYELGETFGGYWGALPNRVMDTSPKEDENKYTIKTTQPTTTMRTKPKTPEPITTTSTKVETNNGKKSVIRANEYVVEVPIVNVSIELVPGLLPRKTFFDTEDTFDKVVDVKPWPNVTYKTKVLPLLQFSLEDKGALRTSAAAAAAAVATDAFVEPEAPAFHINFNPDIFTPDYRLPYSILNFPTKRPQNKYQVTHRLDFKKNKKLLAEKHFFKSSMLPMFQYPTSVSRAHDIFTSHRGSSQSPLRNKQVHKSWDAVKDILKNLNRTDSKSKMHKDVESLLRGLAIVGDNKTGTSAGLVPNASLNVRHPATTTRHTTTKYKTDAITWRQPSATYRTNYLDDEVEETVTSQVSNKTMDNGDGITGLLLPVLDVDTVILNVTQSENKLPSPLNDASTAEGNDTSSTFPRTTMEKPLTLLDHESWENMVHAASLMQVVLNQSVTPPPREDIDTLGGHVTISKLSRTSRRRRKKRFVHAVPIDHLKPHRLPVTMDIPTSTPYSDRISNAQEFQRLIELQDDEMHDRVALRYLRHYIGPVIFNICDFDEAAARHVYLFNSSRLVIAISNFTLERMTVVITPARTLLSSDAHCPSSNLECQVSGARVCIDSLSACDGVPNCGSYDIYDEDRLMCGRSAGLQHNVCLAAITFLAVLLTLLYIVHYWLKRCVPKVSDAFFIYTDAAENVLYLEPIMRSPYDTDDAKYFYRGGGIPDYMQCPDMTMKTNPVSSYITQFLPLRLFRWRCRKKHNAAPVKKEQESEIDFDNQQMFSYDEVEFNRFGFIPMSDTAVQTGSSLMKIQTLDTALATGRSPEFDFEMEDIVAHYEGKRRSTESDNVELEARESRQRESEELSILNFFKRARSVSVDMRPFERRKSIDFLTQLSPPKEEEELQSLDYDPSFVLPESVTSVTTDMSVKKLEHSNVQKKLRFEETTAVPHSENDNVEDLATERNRQSVAYGSGKNVHLERSDSAGHDDEASTSTNRKAYFWGSSKNKPKKVTKKKTQLLPNLKF